MLPLEVPNTDLLSSKEHNRPDDPQSSHSTPNRLSLRDINDVTDIMEVSENYDERDRLLALVERSFLGLAELAHQVDFHSENTKTPWVRGLERHVETLKIWREDFRVLTEELRSAVNSRLLDVVSAQLSRLSQLVADGSKTLHVNEHALPKMAPLEGSIKEPWMGLEKDNTALGDVSSRILDLSAEEYLDELEECIDDLIELGPALHVSLMDPRNAAGSYGVNVNAASAVEHALMPRPRSRSSRLSQGVPTNQSGSFASITNTASALVSCSGPISQDMRFDSDSAAVESRLPGSEERMPQDIKSLPAVPPSRSRNDTASDGSLSASPLLADKEPIKPTASAQEHARTIDTARSESFASIRLINVDSYRLEEFMVTVPQYAILSHTWGDEEISYQDFKDLPIAREKQGFVKIVLTCEQAKRDGLRFAWVDTCCINKSSSHELSETINSMFKFYMNAAVCYVYLVDVPGSCPPLGGDTVQPRQLHYLGIFEDSRWFRRGWTLQELIAPRSLTFFGYDWNVIGTRQELVQRISGITGIQPNILDQSKPLADISIAKRLSWAASRETTRKEDEAYSLLGILDVNMPLLYGEGDKAFLRLQEEISRNSLDQSIFAWNSPSGMNGPREVLLAPSLQCFENARSITRRKYVGNESAFRMSNKGLEITMPIIRRRLHEASTQPYVILGILDCKHEGRSEVLALVMNQHPYGIGGGTLALELYVSGFEQQLDSGLQYSRLVSLDPDELAAAQPTQLTITKDLHNMTYVQAFDDSQIPWVPFRFTGGDPSRIPRLRDVCPDEYWSESLKAMRLDPDRVPFGAATVDTHDEVSVLICFGVVRMSRSRNEQPVKKLLGMSFIDPDCPIRPHMNRTIKKSEGTSERSMLRLSSDQCIVARMWQGALTVSFERGDGSSGSIRSHPHTSSSAASRLPPTPTSPQPYDNRPSSSSSLQRPFRRDPLRTDQRIPARKNISVQSYASSSGSSDSLPQVSRLKTCRHCVSVTEAVKEEEAARIAAERERVEAQEAVRKQRRQKLQAVKGFQRHDASVSTYGMSWDLLENLEVWP